jgi:aspartate/methionine/tyrosine aminotransferase
MFSLFSRRAPDRFEPNRLAQAVQRYRASGRPLCDLTESNPTRAALAHAPDALSALAAPAGVFYEPEPFGLPAARAAVARDLARRGQEIGADRIVLAASTSEAYSYLFKLLCDPGDEVLVPTPSYPLFEHLARLDAIRALPYAMEFHGVWSIDAGPVARAVTPATRAILVVSPNNPTGGYLKKSELAALTALCQSRSLALIGDEVFFDYPLEAPHAPTASVLEQEDVLTFSLGGLSKSAALPQVKLGWMAVGGPAREVERALTRLELIADTYLSVSTPVQLAVASLIDAGARMRPRIQDRLRTNLAVLRRLAAGQPSCEVLPVEGGWSAVVRVPETRSEEELALQLLELDGVLVHPGYFFDFAREAFVVVSLLAPPALFEAGAARLLERASA